MEGNLTVEGIECTAQTASEGKLLHSGKVPVNTELRPLRRKKRGTEVQRYCTLNEVPTTATILINTYRAPTELFVDGDTLLSQEGTTQGDPLAMPMYALATKL